MDGFEICCKTTSVPRLKQGQLMGTGCVGQISNSTPALHFLLRSTLSTSGPGALQAVAPA